MNKYQCHEQKLAIFICNNISLTHFIYLCTQRSSFKPGHEYDTVKETLLPCILLLAKQYVSATIKNELFPIPQVKCVG